jgi:solute carrier family 13 (sodium-dependent dicarboxylate transporter), member 2/3/5
MPKLLAATPPSPAEPELDRPWPRVPWRAALAVSLAIACGLPLWHLAPALGHQASVTLAIFAAAVIAWALLDVDDTVVALTAALALVLAGAVPASTLYAALGHDLIWLLLGGFLLAAVLDASGVAQRAVLRWIGRPRDLASLMRRCALLIAATAFVIPSTSARAVLLLPAFVLLARALDDRRAVRALALLFPTVILLSAGASLTGAGAHLLAVDTLRRLQQPAPDFIGWIAVAGPFSLLAAALACELILRMFLQADERRREVHLLRPYRSVASPAQRRVALLVGATVAALASTGWHGVDPALIALGAALVGTTRRCSGVDLKTALKKVEWNLLLFLAATLVIGQALLDSGAAGALAGLVTRLLPAGTPAGLVVAAVAAVALLSHLVIHSRSARAMVLLPAVALPLAATGVNPALLVFVMVLGSGFCQTLTASAKPVALFAQTELPTYETRDLLRLSLALGPVVWVLLMVFALGVWPLQGYTWAR